MHKSPERFHKTMSQQKKPVSSGVKKENPTTSRWAIFFVVVMFIFLFCLVGSSYAYFINSVSLTSPISFLCLAVVSFLCFRTAQKRYVQRQKYEAYKRKKQALGQKSPSVKKSSTASLNIHNTQKGRKVSHVHAKPAQTETAQAQQQTRISSTTQTSQTHTTEKKKAKTVESAKKIVQSPRSSDNESIRTQEIIESAAPQNIRVATTIESKAAAVVQRHHDQEQTSEDSALNHPHSHQQHLARQEQLRAMASKHGQKKVRPSRPEQYITPASPTVFNNDARKSSDVFDAEKEVDFSSSDSHEKQTVISSEASSVKVIEQTSDSDSASEDLVQKRDHYYQEGQTWTPVTPPRPLYMDREEKDSSSSAHSNQTHSESEHVSPSFSKDSVSHVSEAELAALMFGTQEEQPADNLQNVTNLNEVLERRRRAL